MEIPTELSKLNRRDFLKVSALVGTFFATHSILDLTKWVADYTPPKGLLPGGAITTFEGKIGSGKTLAMTALAYDYQQKYDCKIISNYNLNFPYEPFRVEALESYTDSLVLLDNAFLYIDARNTSTNKSKVISYFFTQTRKRNTSIFLSAPNLDFLDKRIRRMTDVRNRCRMEGDLLHVDSLNLQTGNRYELLIDRKKFYNLFNTFKLLEV